MKKKFLKVAQDGHFFENHEKVLIAVSTGHDSMALLNYLLHYQKELGIELGIVHVNHKQRVESDKEEAFLRTFASERKLPFFVSYYSFSIFSEAKAREFRYQFFQEIMETQGYTALVTAHHADDQAETIFMRWIRGSRLKDLSGIKAIRPFGPGQLIRPLLAFKKEELEVDHFFEDRSNASSAYFRNRVRNQYIPLLEEENPSLADTLLAFGKEVDFLYQAVRDLTNHLDPTDVPIFQEQKPAVQSILLSIYLEKFPDLNLSRSQFDQLLHIINRKANYEGYLKSGYFFVKDYQRFEISKILPQTDSEKKEYVVQSDNIVEGQDWILSLNKEIPHDQKIVVKPDLPIIVRKRQPGDTILVNGVQKKLRRYFIDQKIPISLRNKPIVIEQDKKVMGLVNIVASDLSKSLKNGIISDILYIKMKEN